MITGLVVGSVVAWALARSGFGSVPTVTGIESAWPVPSLPSFDPATRQLAAKAPWAQLTLALSRRCR